MKTLLIIITALFVVQGCKEETEGLGKTWTIYFEVTNKSTKDARIMLYKTNNELFRDTLIKSSDSAIVDQGFLHPAPDGPTYQLTRTLDSAEIIFSDGRKLIQTSGLRGNNDFVNNILLGINYTNYEVQNTDIVRDQFVLTEDDYLRAQ
jgi:hypothetical protein